MTLGSPATSGDVAASSFCSCCGVKMMPYFSDNAVVSQNQINELISENFLTVKGAALFLPRGNGSSPSSVPRITRRRNKHAGDLQQHLQTMFTVLRPEDTIRLAVRLESSYTQFTRYMVIVSTNGRQDTEESVVLGMDFRSSDHACTVGLVLPLWSDTLIHLDGDGGFSVSTANRVHVFKPVSVQAMWSALQSLHKACEVARCHNYYPGSLFLTWVSYYQCHVGSDQHCINEWNAMQDVQSHRADSPVLFTDVPTERERTERLIKTRLREIMMQKDLENVTSKEIRTELEMQMVCNLREFKEFIDNEMIVILGQMDSPTEIFDHVYLGSEWNASNLEELQSSGVRYILNVTREIDNFFPGLFEYHNIRVYDEEATNLLEYWNDTYKFISKAKKAGAKCLVHCKMGVSRSASTVIAYAMKEYGWDLERAFDHVKDRRAVTKPNPSFMKQLEEYQGILLASKQRHNKLWRSHSDGNLSEQRDAAAECKTAFSDPCKSNATPSLEDILGMAVLQALQTQPDTLPAHALEGPFLTPQLRPRAATVVPNVKAAGPVGVISPATDPLQLHPLPPSPTPDPPAEDLAEPSVSVPEQKADSSELPEAMPDERDPKAPNLMMGLSISKSLKLSLDLVGEGADSRASTETPMATTPVSPRGQCLRDGVHTGDDNNNLSDAQISDADASASPYSTFSTDRIEFLSAPEKPLSLSQDGPASSSPSQDQPQPASKDTSCRQLEDEGEGKCSYSEESTTADAVPQPSEPDSVISVHCILPDLEPVLQNVPPYREEEEREETDKPQLPSSVGQRATEQLSPQHAQESHCLPSLSSLPTCSPLPSPPKGNVAVAPSPPGEGTAGNTKEFHEEAPEVAPDFSFPLFSESDLSIGASPVTVPPAPQSKSSSALLWLGGVTELESEVDETAGGHLARSSDDLQKLQETLRELQAFLYEAGGLIGGAETHLNAPPPTTPPPPPAPGEARGAAVWQRAMEIEARIRQAGLTPPSLMKRSASLAKLDCLELSANDLSDWDFHTPSSSAQPPPSATGRSASLLHCADEAHKKQRVLPRNPSANPEQAPPPSDPIRMEDPSHRHRQTGGAGPPEHSHSSPPANTVTMRQQQQHAKTHSARRLRKGADKKKTVTVLYNTM